MNSGLRRMVAAVGVVAICGLGMSGCKKKEEGALEKFGKSADEAVEKGADKAKEAAEELEE